MLNFKHIGVMVAATAALACSDTTGPETVDERGQLTVDASASWAFVALGDEAAPVNPANPATSGSWDVAFFATTVMLNGGAAGPGGVLGYCVCQNQGVPDAQLLTRTPESERAAFDAVTLASVPAEASAWASDALAPAITGWYAYNPVTHQVSAAPSKVWKLRLAESANPAFAKLHVIGVEGASQTNAGRVTIEYAVQTGAGASMGAVGTATLDVSAGNRVYFDFVRGAVTDASDWDIALEGYDIRLNSGVSGSGSAGAVLASETFAAMTDASDAPAQVYRADAYGGVFDTKRWYRYNLTGSHDITPTYDVYLIKRGNDIYKVQLIGYYDRAGNDRRITFRYARVTS